MNFQAVLGAFRSPSSRTLLPFVTFLIYHIDLHLMLIMLSRRSAYPTTHNSFLCSPRRRLVCVCQPHPGNAAIDLILPGHGKISSPESLFALLYVFRFFRSGKHGEYLACVLSIRLSVSNSTSTIWLLCVVWITTRLCCSLIFSHFTTAQYLYCEVMEEENPPGLVAISPAHILGSEKLDRKMVQILWKGIATSGVNRSNSLTLISFCQPISFRKMQPSVKQTVDWRTFSGEFGAAVPPKMELTCIFWTVWYPELRSRSIFPSSQMSSRER